MANYDFKNLNDKEFEVLVTDLLSAEFGNRIERFKPGRDLGVDGRFFIGPGDEAIIQSKHYLKSGYKALLRKLSKDELPKVKKLAPKRYIVSTSLELSRVQKQEIRKALAPYVISESDIFGAEDLNDLLKKHRAIEENHYKLWISSTGVLKIIFNSAIKGRSRDFLEEALEESQRYVITDNHTSALDKINKENVVILTGEPGVGKTTLANGLCVHFAAKEFEVVCIEGDLRGAESVFDDEKPQIFYFDDFLGSNYLTALENREDSYIVRFIRRIKKHTTKRFVLTSRTNIMNQGKRLSDKFLINNIDKNELEVELKNISQRDKAHILYNHIYYSDLPDDYIDKLYVNKRYMEIINHTNFNPRLIQFITDKYKLSSVSPEKYWDYISSTLDNPVHVWDTVYNIQIDGQCRDLVALVVMNGTRLDEVSLIESFQSLCRSIHNGAALVDYRSAARTVTGALLNREISSSSKEVYYELFNPSVGDYVIRRVVDNGDYLCLLFYSLQTVQSLQNLRALYTNDILAETNFIRIIEHLSVKVHSQNFDYEKLDYNFILMEIIFKNLPRLDEQQMKGLLKETFLNLVLEDCTGANSLYLLGALSYSTALVLETAYHVKLYQFLTELIDEDYLCHEEFVLVCSITKAIACPGIDNFRCDLKKKIIDFWEDNAHTFIVEEGTIDDVFLDEDLETATDRVNSKLNDTFHEYSFDFTDDDFEIMTSYIDVADIINENLVSEARAGEYEYGGSRSGCSGIGISDAAYIQDLFTRD